MSQRWPESGADENRRPTGSGSPKSHIHDEPTGHGGALRRWHAWSARRERRLEQTGREPDPRFTLANERSFLAWNRTALALIVSGLAAAQFLHFTSTV